MKKIALLLIIGFSMAFTINKLQAIGGQNGGIVKLKGMYSPQTNTVYCPTAGRAYCVVFTNDVPQ